MISRLLGAILLVPIVLLLSFWTVNFISAVLVGEINLVSFIVSHRFIIALVMAYFGFKYLNPFRRD